MAPADARDAAAEVIRRCEEAARLTEAFCARVRGGDDDGGPAFCRDREAILAAIRALEAVAAEGADPEAAVRHRTDRARAIRRILELDRELIGLLDARKARLRVELQGLQQGRRSLHSYRGPAGTSPAVIDRLG